MKNVLKSGDIKSLKEGQVLLTQLREVSNGFMSIELAEVKKGSKGLSAVFLFNKSDSRFSNNSARRAWQNGQPSDIEELLGISTDDSQPWIMNDKGFKVLPLNILNPIASYEGTDYIMRVQIQETLEPTDYQAANVETAAKRKGKNGEFITHNEEYIFTNATIVFNEPEDMYLETDTLAVVTSTPTEKVAHVDTLTGEIFN
mgnify:CR=1 FL=1